MRRLSIQLTCLLALLPALSLGCAGSSYEEASDVAFAEHKSEAAPADRSYGGAAPSMDYDYADDMAAAEEAPAPTGAPAPMAEAAAPGMAGGDGEGPAIGTASARPSAPAPQVEEDPVAAVFDALSLPGLCLLNVGGPDSP